VLPAASDTPALYDYGYRNGGNEFVNIDPNWAHYGEIPFGNPEPYERVSVDVALRSDEPGQVTYIGCRRASNVAIGYRLLLDAPGQRAVLERLDNTRSYTLRKLTDLPNIAASPAPNHLELTCGAPTISASVNGVLIASADDFTYTGGYAWLGASNLPNVQVTTDALFSNLVVTQD
jgi:hypothetical protein